jgi:hypothetical protein
MVVPGSFPQLPPRVTQLDGAYILSAKCKEMNNYAQKKTIEGLDPKLTAYTFAFKSYGSLSSDVFEETPEYAHKRNRQSCAGAPRGLFPVSTPWPPRVSPAIPREDVGTRCRK